MDVIAGVSATRVYQLIYNGLPTAGATLTYAFTGPDGAAVTLQSSAVTDNGDGTYSVELDGSADIPSAGTGYEVWDGSYAGRDIHAEGPVYIGSSADRAITRRELRWRTARRLNDLWRGTATATSASAVTLPEFAAPTNDWKGHEIYVYAGTGIGQARQVTLSSNQSGVLSVLSWTTEPVGASIEGHKRFTVDQYNAALQDAVLGARGVWVSMEVRTLVQVTGQTAYPIPAGLIWLSSVETLDSTTTDTWTPLVRREGAWDAWPGTLRLAAGGTTGVRMRLLGYRYPQQLEYDEQFADLDAAYLTEMAAGFLSASQVRAPALDRSAAAQNAAYHTTLAGAQLRRSALQDAVRVAE